MALTFSDPGKVLALDALFLSGYAGEFWIRLSQNDPAVFRAMPATDFMECNFSGYAAIKLVFPTSAIILPGPTPNYGGQITGNNVTFNGSGAGITNTVYWYYVTTVSGSAWWWAERLATAPMMMGAGGSSLQITPRVTCKSEFNN